MTNTKPLQTNLRICREIVFSALFRRSPRRIFFSPDLPLLEPTHAVRYCSAIYTASRIHRCRLLGKKTRYVFIPGLTPQPYNVQKSTFPGHRGFKRMPPSQGPVLNSVSLIPAFLLAIGAPTEIDPRSTLPFPDFFFFRLSAVVFLSLTPARAPYDEPAGILPSFPRFPAP